MPNNEEFKKANTNIRKNLCPLVWDKDKNTGFVDAEESSKFVYYLVKTNVLPFVSEDDKKIKLEQMENKYSPSLLNLIKNNELNGELLHRKLCFENDFSYDVVLKLTDLSRGLGIEETYFDFVQATVAEK